jgi:type III secretory pathway component EscU
MIGNIYYLIGVLVVLSTISTILKFGKLYSLKEWKEKYEKIVGRKPSKRDFRSKKEYSLSESSNILGVFELIWIIGGFFTSSWYIFGIILLLSYILNIILKPIKFTILHKLISITFLLTRLCLYLYLIVNHFYLHQNTYSIVKHYIKW